MIKCRRCGRCKWRGRAISVGLEKEDAMNWARWRVVVAGLEIATDTVANATKTLNLATKNSSFVATLVTMFLWYVYESLKWETISKVLFLCFCKRKCKLILRHIKQLQSLLVFNYWQNFFATVSSSLHGFLAFIFPDERNCWLCCQFPVKNKTNKEDKQKFWKPGLAPNFSCENMF